MFRNAITLPFRLLGIPVKLDRSFLLILPLLAWLIGSQVPGYAALLRGAGLEVDVRALQDGLTPFLLGLGAALGLFVSVVLHELGHALAARLYGVHTREITLWFLGGVAQFDEMPRGRGAEALVALAGPLVSFGLAAILWQTWQRLALPDAALFVLSYLSVTNGFLAVFNLLPALPLDGGRILRSLLALRLDHLQATRLAAAVSQTIAVALGLYGLVRVQLFTVALAFFIFNAARSERQHALLAGSFEALAVRDLMTREVVSVEPELPLETLLRLAQFRRYAGYPVLEAGRLVGFVRLEDAQEALEGGSSSHMSVADVMRPAETIAEDEAALKALGRVAESSLGRLVVLGAAGRMVGILSKTDLVRRMQGALEPGRTAPDRS